jgi:NAD(P)-dependent dehydrogenase (short-subunit alcohol dehydrogenase family)
MDHSDLNRLAATTHIAKYLASTLAPYSIRVNAIAPGLFPTVIAEGLIAQGQGSAGQSQDLTEEGAFAKLSIPAGRLGKTDDIAGAVLYMARAAGAYLNGNIQVIDGGRISQLNAKY